MASNDDVENIEIALVLEAIHARYGYDLRQYSLPSIRRRVSAAMRKSGATHFGEFQHRLLVDPAFFATVFEDLTIQVSEMFRDPPFYAAFRSEVVPFLRTYPELKVWHAGCAGGEEVYATAILLMEENLYDRAQIYATDISESALEKAREGLYSDKQAAAFSENYARSGGTGQFADYFSSAYGHVAVKAALRKNVVFFQHDLTTDYALGEMHVVFCRNVLIYFGSSLRDRVLAMLGQSLSPGGFLCLGSRERVAANSALFQEFMGAARIYRLSRGPYST
jgi:chemotaxis protein methyltransferase CheR